MMLTNYYIDYDCSFLLCKNFHMRKTLVNWPIVHVYLRKRREQLSKDMF